MYISTIRITDMYISRIQFSDVTPISLCQWELTICRNYFVICTYQEFQNSWYVHIASSELNSKMVFHRVALNISTAAHVLGRPLFAVKVADSHVGIWTPSNMWFPESTSQNGILIGSAVVARLTVVTDRPHYSICCNRLRLASVAMRPNNTCYCYIYGL